MTGFYIKMRLRSLASLRDDNLAFMGRGGRSEWRLSLHSLLPPLKPAKTPVLPNAVRDLMLLVTSHQFFIKRNKNTYCI